LTNTNSLVSGAAKFQIFVEDNALESFTENYYLVDWSSSISRAAFSILRVCMSWCKVLKGKSSSQSLLFIKKATHRTTTLAMVVS